MSEQAIAEHLAAYHGFSGVGNDPYEAAAANYCTSLTEFHQELHNPDFYHDTGEDLPTHSVEELWTAQPPTYHSDALGTVTIPED
jgi:hypothetical protein